VITLGHKGEDAPPEPQDNGCRIANPDEVPRTAKSLIALAIEYGWHVTTTYARGWTEGTKRFEPKQVETIAVRLFRIGDPRVVAVWEDGKFKFGATSRLLSLNSKQVRELVKA
jgi:hypothetical protein